MVVLSNHRLGGTFELLVADAVASAMFRAVADAARSNARSRWELELVRWLDQQAGRSASFELDVGEIAWTRDHFAAQRQFVIDAIGRAGTEHRAMLERWAALIEAHPASSVQVGRRWIWRATA
jgi:hypothetical protein